MTSSSGVSRFDRISRLLWAVLVLTLVGASILTQVTSRGLLAAVPSDISEQDIATLLPSVAYAGSVWAIESSRLSPPSATGITTVIIETQVHNRMDHTNYVMHRDGVELVAEWGERIELDRFANNSSEHYLHVAAAESKSLTMAFKTSHSNFDFDDWNIEIVESRFHTPAVLPLVGEANQSVIELGFEGDDNKIYTFERVVASPNHNSRRALSGRAFLHVEVSADDVNAPAELSDTRSWEITTDLESTKALQVDSVRLEDKISHYVTFDVDVKATRATLEVGPPGAEIVINVVASQLD